MLSDQDVSDIKKAAFSNLRNNCIGFNCTIDQSRLLDAIAKAIAEAIKQYDQMQP